MNKRILSVLVILVISTFVFACGRGGRGVFSSPILTVGGVVSGLTGTVVLQNNGGDDLAIHENGPFTFPTAIAPGSSFEVTVRTNPVGQTCLVTNGTGTVVISNITNMSVDCFITGGLDIAFNAPTGFTVQSNTAGGNGGDIGNAMTIDAQGRILVAGQSVNGAGNFDMVLWRFNADGSLDKTFNGTGFVVHNSAAEGNGDDIGNAVTIDPRGRILVAGQSVNGAGNFDMAIWRFNADGSPDTTLNGSGFAVHDSAAGSNADDTGNAVIVGSLDRIIIVGNSRNIAGNTDMVIWRLNANGTFDTTFGGDGIVVHNGAAGGNGDDSGSTVVIDAQDRILVAGRSVNGAGNADMVVWRFDVDGGLDAAFNGSGIFVHNSAAGGNGDDIGNAITIDSQGRILITGSSRNIAGNADLAIWRLSADGTLDATFDRDGIVINNGAAGSNGDDSGNDITIDSQGRILIAGSSRNVAGNTDMVIWRFNTNGIIDTTFAADGIGAQNGSAGGNADDSGKAIVLADKERILVAGSSGNGAGNADMVVWRLLP